jgi:hypothetical protein
MDDFDVMIATLEQDMSTEMSKHIYINAGNKLWDKSIDKDGEAGAKKAEAHRVLSTNDPNALVKAGHLIQAGKDASAKSAQYYNRAQKLIKYGENK